MSLDWKLLGLKTKAEALHASLRCFCCGLIGLIPLLGVPFCLAAMAYSARVSASNNMGWNAAQNYMIAGGICALLGMMANLILIATAAIAIGSAIGNW